MRFDFAPWNRFDGAGIKLGRATLEFKPPFIFVEEFWLVVHKRIINLFREHGAGREWMVCCCGVKMGGYELRGLKLRTR